MDEGRAVLWAGVCVLLSCPASAQEMVFSVEETGQPALPAVADDSPPSETLANSLRLYQRERYAESAVQLQRVVQGESDDGPANVEKAQFFLAKCLFHLRYFRAALGVFDEITQRGESHRFFEPALPWLAQLATQLPEPAGIIELVGRYGPDRVAALETEETREVHDHLLYLSGRYAYSQGELDDAVQRFDRVTLRSEHYGRARFFAGITHVRLRRARPAIEAFRAVLAAADRGQIPEVERMRNLAWLSLARVYYTAANRTDENGDRTVDPSLLENAVEAWDRIAPSSEHWLDALFEQAWALFLSDEQNRAMGNVHALFSPYFADAYYPEALIIKAVVFFSACQLENAEAMVHQFHDRYDPVREEMTAAMSRFEDNEQFYRFLTRVRRGEAELSERIRGPVSSAMSDRTLLRHLDYVRLLDEEQARLDASPVAFQSSALADRIRAEVLVSRSFAVDRTGDMARARFTRLVDELDELMNQADTVEVEIYRVVRDGLSREQLGEQERIRAAGGLEIEVDEEHQIWPFDGEYWRDELPFYRQRVSSICTR